MNRRIQRLEHHIADMVVVATSGPEAAPEQPGDGWLLSWEERYDYAADELEATMDPAHVQIAVDEMDAADAAADWSKLGPLSVAVDAVLRRAIGFAYEPWVGPLALPPVVGEILLTNPEALWYTTRLKGDAQCGECGFRVPYTWDIKEYTRPLLDRCPLCDGKVGILAYRYKHAAKEPPEWHPSRKDTDQ